MRMMLFVLGVFCLLGGMTGCSDGNNDINVPSGDISNATVAIREWRFPQDEPVKTIPPGDVQAITPGVQWDVVAVEEGTTEVIPGAIITNLRFEHQGFSESNFTPIDFVNLHITPNPPAGTIYVGWDDANPLVGTNFFRRIERSMPQDVLTIACDITVNGTTASVMRFFITLDPPQANVNFGSVAPPIVKK